jgi:Ring finger domain
MPEMTCTICLENLAGGPEPVGVSTPCGHCVHVACWDGWAASRLQHLGRRHAVKCPTCNTPSAGFCRLFVDFGNPPLDSDGGSNDLSLSSDDDEEEEDGHANEASSDTETAPDKEEEEEEGRSESNEDGALDNSVNDDAAVDAIDVGSSDDVIEIDDDDDENSEPIVAGRACQQVGAPNINGKSDRYKRLATRYKRKASVLNSQRKEQAKKRLILVGQLERQTKAMAQVTSDYNEAKTKCNSLRVENERLHLTDIQTSRELSTVKGELSLAEQKYAQATSELKFVKDHYEEMHRIQNAKSMAEVKQMIQERPILQKENQQLRALTRRLQEQLRQMQTTGSDRSAFNSSGNEAKRKAPAMQLSTRRLLRAVTEEHDRALLSQKRPAPASMARDADGDLQRAQVSAHAARLSKAASKSGTGGRRDGLATLNAMDNVKLIEPIVPSFLQFKAAHHNERKKKRSQPVPTSSYHIAMVSTKSELLRKRRSFLRPSDERAIFLLASSVSPWKLPVSAHVRSRFASNLNFKKCNASSPTATTSSRQKSKLSATHRAKSNKKHELILDRDLPAGWDARRNRDNHQLVGGRILHLKAHSGGGVRWQLHIKELLLLHCLHN